MIGNLELVFWDVQHGNATYIKTPNGRHMVIDLGIGSWDDNKTLFSPLMHLKNRYGVKQLDGVTITHPHLDHIDDILNLEGLSPQTFTRPKHITNQEVMSGVRNQDRAKFERYCKFNNDYSTPVDSTSIYSIDNPNNWGGLRVKEFLSTGCDRKNLNNHSIITVLEYLNTKIVIPGDNERCSLEELMQVEAFRDAVKGSEILLAPHHGRESAYHSEFVTLVNPLLTVVSDGSICDTSANGRYSAKSRGWDVWKNSLSDYQKRYCLTTNSDGEVFVEIKPSDDPKYKSILNVSIK